MCLPMPLKAARAIIYFDTSMYPRSESNMILVPDESDSTRVRVEEKASIKRRAVGLWRPGHGTVTGNISDLSSLCLAEYVQVYGLFSAQIN